MQRLFYNNLEQLNIAMSVTRKKLKWPERSLVRAPEMKLPSGQSVSVLEGKRKVVYPAAIPVSIPVAAITAIRSIRVGDHVKVPPHRVPLAS